jgi:glycine/D-amino acid oxidase-like deaminating enzyme
MNASDPTVHGSSWYAATMAASPTWGPLTFDLDVDVCVIGGGLAGLTTAREVARRGWSVAVLEAQRIAWNASGRNCGFVLPGFAEGLDRIIERVGLERAKALWALSKAGVDYVASAMRETRMPGVEPVSGWLNVSKVDDDEEFLQRLGLLLDEFGLDIEVWSPERVRDVLKSESYFHAVHFPRAFSIHPLNYARGLAAAAEQQGARIFEQTPALSIDPAGVRKRVVTPAARVRASHIVLAGGTHLGAVAPRVSDTVVPVTTYVVTTAPLGDRLSQAVTYRGAVSDTQRADSHYRIVDGDRLMWAGRMTTWSSNPRRQARHLVADIARIYPQLGEVPIDYAWSGVMAFAVHKMPQIGEVTPGIWLAGAFGGHGINTTAMAGTLVARGLVDGDDTWRLFSPYELIWAGGICGRAAAQVAYWTYRAKETIAMRRALRREAERRVAISAAGQATDTTAVARPGHAAVAQAVLAPQERMLGAATEPMQAVVRRAQQPPIAPEQAPPQAPGVAERRDDNSVNTDGPPQAVPKKRPKGKRRTGTAV